MDPDQLPYGLEPADLDLHLFSKRCNFFKSDVHRVLIPLNMVGKISSILFENIV